MAEKASRVFGCIIGWWSYFHSDGNNPREASGGMSWVPNTEFGHRLTKKMDSTT